MRALVNSRPGGIDVLVVEERPDLAPKPGEVLIAVKRAGLNFADIQARMGQYPDAPKFPAVMGYEVSGTVAKLGPDVTGFAEGDKVVTLCRFGGQASQVTAPASQVRKMPEGMTFDEAAAIPVNYLTAWQMLCYMAPIQPGMSVLIHAAAGGVGLAAIQLCQRVKDVEIIGTASPGKHAMLKAAGVHHTIDYRSQDYVAEVKRITNGRGVHRILDALGGDDWNKGYSLLRSGGVLLVFGWSNMVQGEKRSYLHLIRELLKMRKFSPMSLMDKNRGVAGVNMGHLWHEGEQVGLHLDALLKAWEAKEIAPHVDKVFPLSRAGEGHAYVQARKNVGKVLFDCEA